MPLRRRHVAYVWEEIEEFLTRHRRKIPLKEMLEREGIEPSAPAL
jgi:hypothetical protein